MVAILLPRDQLWHQLSSVVTQTIIVNSNGVQLFNEKSHQASKIACDASNKSPTSIFLNLPIFNFLTWKGSHRVFRKCPQIVWKMTKASVEITTTIFLSNISYSVEITTKWTLFCSLLCRSDFETLCNCDEENLGEQWSPLYFCRVEHRNKSDEKCWGEKPDPPTHPSHFLILHAVL